MDKLVPIEDGEAFMNPRSSREVLADQCVLVELKQ